MMRCTLAAGAVVFFALIGFTWYTGHRQLNFANLAEAKATMSNAGCLCLSDREDGVMGSGFLLSREFYPWNKACLLCKIGPMGPEWEGKVWVTSNTPDWKLASLPDNAGVRMWGEVIAFGDEQMLREIESRFGSSFSQ
jgi:hypothetical protein